MPWEGKGGEGKRCLFGPRDGCTRMHTTHTRTHPCYTQTHTNIYTYIICIMYTWPQNGRRDTLCGKPRTRHLGARSISALHAGLEAGMDHVVCALRH